MRPASADSAPAASDDGGGWWRAAAPRGRSGLGGVPWAAPVGEKMPGSMSSSPSSPAPAPPPPCPAPPTLCAPPARNAARAAATEGENGASCAAPAPRPADWSRGTRMPSEASRPGATARRAPARSGVLAAAAGRPAGAGPPTPTPMAATAAAASSSAKRLNRSARRGVSVRNLSTSSKSVTHGNRCNTSLSHWARPFRRLSTTLAPVLQPKRLLPGRRGTATAGPAAAADASRRGCSTSARASNSL
mmetsp:Transcript_10575/g.41109  ORF Transcript_10575/g.41109 Transcript_10575/m.41109 type:complete len:247 (+) Transcript_10575:516-1256(+)